MQETLDGDVKAHFTCFDIYCCAKSTFCWIVYSNIKMITYYLEFIIELYIIIVLYRMLILGCAKS